MNLLEQLQNAGIPYTENEPMSRCTTFGIGGPALLLHPLYFGPGQQSAGQR